MNKNKKSLDEYFDQTRSIPPFISKDSARQFLERNANQYSSVFETRPFYLNKKYYITGAAMATFAIIIFFVTSIFNHSHQQAVTTPQNVFQKPTAQITADSTKEKSNQKTINSENKFTTPKQLSKTEIDLNTKQNNVDQKKVNPNVSFASWTPEKIHEIKIFELDSVELDRIGITKLSDGSIQEILGTDRPFRMSWKQVDTNRTSYYFPIKGNRIVDTLSNSLLQKQHFNPIVITDNIGNKYHHNPNYEAYSADKLLPIKIDKTPFLHQQPNDQYFIFWFERTPEFIAVLPRRIQQIIQSENDEGLKQVDSEFTNKSSKNIHPIETTVYPNPISTNTTTLQYTLSEQSRVAVSLYNIQGQRIKELAVTDRLEKGKWIEQLSLGDLQAGMYLLAVMTDKGEQSVQRIMVLK